VSIAFNGMKEGLSNDMPITVPLSENRQPLPAILAAATDEFISQGYRGASIDRIVAAARISKTTFYALFHNKRNVLEAALDSVEATLNDRFPLPGPLSSVEHTLALYSKWVRRVANSPEYVGLYRVSLELARAEPEFAQTLHMRIRDQQGQLWHYIKTLLPDVAASRGIAAIITAQFGFVSIGGLMTVLRTAPPSVEYDERWASSVAKLFASGYRRRAKEDDALPSGPAQAFPADLESSEMLYARRRSAGMRLSRNQFEDLLAASADAFLENGYRDAALPDIAARTGVSRMTLRRQFDGKADLFVAAISHYAHNLYSRPEPFPNADSMEAALPVMAAHLRNLFYRPDNVRLLRLMVSQSMAFPALVASVYALSRENELHNIRQVFARWTAEGKLSAQYADILPYHFHTLAVNGNGALFRMDHAQTDASPAQVGSLFLDGCLQPVSI
jgi:AcrR family transcriptional regulator